MFSSPHIILRKLLQEINNSNNNNNNNNNNIHHNTNEHGTKNHVLHSTSGTHINHTEVLSNTYSHPDKAIKEVINVITKKKVKYIKMSCLF